MAFGYFLNILLGKPWLEGESDNFEMFYLQYA